MWATMNGKWILMEWYPKNNLLTYTIDEKTKAGKTSLNWWLPISENTRQFTRLH